MATKNQIPKLAGTLVEHQEHFDGLTTEEAQWVIFNPKEAIGIFKAGVRTRVAAVTKKVDKTVAKILELVNDEIRIPALQEAFGMKDHFQVDTSLTAKVKISFVSDSVRDEFGSQVVVPRDGYAVSARRLLKRSADRPILTELRPVYKTDMPAVKSLMAQQPNGEPGVLLTDGQANIFYVEKSAGVLRAVRVRWSDDGWDVRSSSVKYPGEWNAGSQVFSRNSSVLKLL